MDASGKEASSSDAEVGGRVFFTDTGRTLEQEDEIQVTSVGVDIGSSTSHLVFSRISLERLDSRYVVSKRETLHESDILLTPYAGQETIDAVALGAFIQKQYAAAGIEPEDVDTGALILTGVAVRRANARRIGELFASQAGKMVAVSAGDNLETTMAAFGSGAISRSIRERGFVMNIDIGGGTSKIAVCAEGKVIDLTAVDIGARLICFDSDGRVCRIEEAGGRIAEEMNIPLALGIRLAATDMQALAGRMTDRLFEAIEGKTPTVGGSSLLRLDPLVHRGPIDQVSFSGGVSEYIYGREATTYGDLGPLLAAEVRKRLDHWGPRLERPAEGIRATVVGASQYTMQVSGGTIFVSPLDTLPLRNVPVVTPGFRLDDDTVDASDVAAALTAAMRRLDLTDTDGPLAIAYAWQGSAMFSRIDGFCRGIAQALSDLMGRGQPIVLVGDSDIGGLIGLHFREEMKLLSPVVSIDGIELKEFDFIDIGTILEASGAVPVVIKSLIFPATAAIGKEWEAGPHP